MVAGKTVTAAQVDWILHNTAELRELAMSLEPKTSTSIAATDHAAYVVSPLERVVADREAILVVVDTVEEAVMTARPRVLRTLVRLRYGGPRPCSRQRIARSLHYSISHTDRLIRLARTVVGHALADLPDGTLQAFWRTVRRLQPGGLPRRVTEPLDPDSPKVAEAARKISEYAAQRGANEVRGEKSTRFSGPGPPAGK